MAWIDSPRGRLHVDDGGAGPAVPVHHVEPGIPVRVMTGTSHWLMMDHPDEFNAILDGFLEGVR